MKRVTERVPIAVAASRALAYLNSLHRSDVAAANTVGYQIWPDVKMTSQGAGGAASRVLKTLVDAGLAEWHYDGTRHGWRATATGRRSF